MKQNLCTARSKHRIRANIIEILRETVGSQFLSLRQIFNIYQHLQLLRVSLGASVPNAPNTMMREELRRVFETLDPVQTHAAMVATLKKTRDLRPLADLLLNVPNALQAAALSIPFKKE